MQHEFMRIVDERLIESWGKGAYPEQNVMLLWRYVRDITTTEFETALDDLAMTVTRAPPIGQVRGACLPAIRRAIEVKKREMVRKASEGSTCLYCGGHGWIYALSYDNPLAEFAFLCSYCPAPSLLNFTTSHGARAWTADDAHGFFLRRYDERSHLEAEALQREASDKLVAKMRAKLEAEVAKHADSAVLQPLADLLQELPF